MFNPSWSVISFVTAVALLPLAGLQSEKRIGQSGPTLSVSLSAKPVTLGVHVATVMRPLDLAALTNADFGDVDALN